MADTKSQTTITCRKCGAIGTHHCSVPGCPLPPLKEETAPIKTTGPQNCAMPLIGKPAMSDNQTTNPIDEDRVIDDLCEKYNASEVIRRLILMRNNRDIRPDAEGNNDGK